MRAINVIEKVEKKKKGKTIAAWKSWSRDYANRMI